jgi:flavin-dependent dehydrogenase
MRDPERLLRQTLAADAHLRPRFAAAKMTAPPTVLGPLAVDAIRSHPDGLIVAGDAAGFVDPMTGDGLRFAIQGGELAALAALRVFEHGWTGVQRSLTCERRRRFGGKWRFNRALRRLVASPAAIRFASAGAGIAPAAIRSLVARAGDCGLTMECFVAGPVSSSGRG